MADSYTLDKEISLDTLLDDIPELPGYTVLYTGVYHVVLEKGIEIKEINDDSYFSVEGTVKEIGELSEKLKEGETPPKVGDIQSFLFDRTHAVAMNNFKQFILAPIAKQFNLKTVAEVVEISKGIEMVWVGKRTYDEKKDRHNFNLKKTMMV